MPPVKTIVIKITISMLIGLLSGLALNEVAYVLLHETSRAPKVIEIVIPNGTAEQVARGEAPPTIPDSMYFVVGDTLVVKNNDWQLPGRLLIIHELFLRMSRQET